MVLKLRQLKKIALKLSILVALKPIDCPTAAAFPLSPHIFYVDQTRALVHELPARVVALLLLDQAASIDLLWRTKNGAFIS